jgi:hypothetical protein
MKQACAEMPAAFRITDAVVGLFAIGLLVALLGPALAQSRANSQRDACIANAKELAIGVLKYESARRTLPLASTQFITGNPGDAGKDDPAGFSWLVKSFVYSSRPEARLYVEKLLIGLSPVTTDADWNKKSPFDPTVTAPTGGGRQPQRELAMPNLLCPSFIDMLQPGQEGGKDRPPIDPTKLPAITNYHALAGSHFFNRDGIGRLLPADRLTKTPDGRTIPADPYEGNGAMPFPGMTGNVMTSRGLRMSRISDGPAVTFLFAETVEREFSAWLDGQTTWLVAAWPATPDVPQLLPLGSRTDKNPNNAYSWSAEQLAKNWTSLGKRWSPNAEHPTPPYLPAARWSGAKDRQWGPSSLHQGMVTHAFVDGRVQMISEDVDKNVYLHMATRDGREIVILPDPGR